MNWQEARELRSRYPFFEFGGHTRDHIDLRTHVGETARFQIAGCAEDLQRELGLRPGHFSYPYSRWCLETKDLVIEMGWQSAVGMSDGFRIGTTSDRFAMPRVESPRTMTELRFKTSGAYPGTLSMLGLT
jgi:peptidoglycan/xylan/chitin deacetylase (PgdA/CDA1 family)